MTLEEIIHTLKEDHDAEDQDSSHYAKLAEWMREKYPDRGYACILEDMSEEEAVHRKHLENILRDMGAMDTT